MIIIAMCQRILFTAGTKRRGGSHGMCIRRENCGTYGVSSPKLQALLLLSIHTMQTNVVLFCFFILTALKQIHLTLNTLGPGYSSLDPQDMILTVFTRSVQLRVDYNCYYGVMWTLFIWIHIRNLAKVAKTAAHEEKTNVHDLPLTATVEI